jgi:hypothetical protein
LERFEISQGDVSADPVRLGLSIAIACSINEVIVFRIMFLGLHVERTSDHEAYPRQSPEMFFIKTIGTIKGQTVIRILKEALESRKKYSEENCAPEDIYKE